MASQESQYSSQDSSQDSLRAWGSFQVEVDGKSETIRFTKQGDTSRAGYVFGCDPECDVILPPSKQTSPRHFVVYKEMVNAAECVFLQVLSSNGIWLNGVRTEGRQTAKLDHGDHVTYIADTKGLRRCFSPIYKFVKGDPCVDTTFDSQFELGSQLGLGNFAKVNKAREKKSGVIYAVKIIERRKDVSPKFSQSLEREIGTLMSIDHPNLIRVHKVFVEQSHYYLVTELARGGELFDYIRDLSKLTEPQARHVFRQLLNGVKYLHDHGIVHRDLKLENILIMDRAALTIKISDFGLSNIIGEYSYLKTVCGTPSYVAPEVLRKVQYGKPVDMWSLGVMFYIFLCGFPPFSDDFAPPSMRIQVLECLYQFPSPYWDDVSDEAVDLVQGLLMQSAKKRLTVKDALGHNWMQLGDDEGTFPEKARTEIDPGMSAAVTRIMTQRSRVHERTATTLKQPFVNCP
ncbi:kinase-like domain-containing protein [Mortierella sp. GBAus27b]|nr:hypothetical protein BGX31_007318 [Mortierella sp. GBA43]KAI8346532.1 kinase-like domain-containing protein [Mortierella sp. GBAus27b]